MAAQIQQLFTDLVDNAQAPLDTLNELAAAFADDATFAQKVQTALKQQSRLFQHIH